MGVWPSIGMQPFKPTSWGMKAQGGMVRIGFQQQQSFAAGLSPVGMAPKKTSVSAVALGFADALGWIASISPSEKLSPCPAWSSDAKKLDCTDLMYKA